MSAHVSSGKQTRLDTISYQAFCIFFFIKSVTCWVLSSYISSCRTTLSTTSALQKKALKIELFLRWPVTTLQQLVHVESTRWSHTLPVNFHPRQFCLQLNAPYLRRFRAPISVSFSLSATVNTLVFFFFSQAEHNLHISSFIFNLSATSLRAQHRRGGPIEVEWALPSLMSGYPSKYCKILIWRLSSPPRYIKWLLFHWWSDILFLWSSLSEAQLCYSGDLWPILLL